MLRTERIQRITDFVHKLYMYEYDKAGYPYIFHLIEVAEMMRGDETAVMVALLHDAFEDSFLRIEEYRGLWPDEVVDAVDVLTRRSGEIYMEYIKRVKESPLATRVKIADLEHHLKSEENIPFSLAERYRKALKELKNA